MVDLHIHTKFSDGTDSIEELIDKLIKKGITYFSITDHDGIGGVAYLLKDDVLLEKLKKHNIMFENGVEFSSIIGDNKIHLLGYDFLLNEDMLDIVAIGQEKRLHKFNLRIDAMKEQFGMEFKPETLKELREMCDFVGKPILARYMQKDGLCDDYDLCFTKYLNKLEVPAYEVRVDANLVVPAIISSGGVCVWAHPYGGIGEPRITIEKVEEIINLLLPLGLKGLECYYNMYTKKEIDDLVKLAKKYNLRISAGSDYHGKNKKVKLAEICSDKNIVLSENEVTIIKEFKNK